VPRILGVDVPGDKRAEIALTYIYGIGRYRSNVILNEAGIKPGTPAKELTTDDVSRITNIIQSKYAIEGDLRRETQANVKRLISIHSYRGARHLAGLPVRGQRTHTNARTRKGPKKGQIALKRKGK
jgi:small subunit ribosomal protein S13